MHLNILSLLQLNLDNLVKHPILTNVEGKIENIEDRVSVEYKTLGISFNFSTPNTTVTSIFIYSEGKDGYTQYSGEIPNDVKFNLSQKDIKKKLGEPRRSGGNYEDKLFGYTAPWDSYYFDNYTMHVTYKKDTNSIDMITIMTPDATPGRIIE